MNLVEQSHDEEQYGTTPQLRRLSINLFVYKKTSIFINKNLLYLHVGRGRVDKHRITDH